MQARTFLLVIMAFILIIAIIISVLDTELSTLIAPHLVSCNPGVFFILILAYLVQRVKNHSPMLYCL